MAQPEKLNLWDRIFNRTRREVVEEGEETWCSYHPENDLWWYRSQKIENSEFNRQFIKYKIIDRLTGSETIKKIYLD